MRHRVDEKDSFSRLTPGRGTLLWHYEIDHRGVLSGCQFAALIGRSNLLCAFCFSSRLCFARKFIRFNLAVLAKVQGPLRKARKKKWCSDLVVSLPRSVRTVVAAPPHTRSQWFSFLLLLKGIGFAL